MNSSKKQNDIARAIYLSLKGKEGGEFSEALQKVTQFLYKKRLLFKAPIILKNLEKIINKEEQKIVATLQTARSLGNREKDELKEILKNRYTAKEIEFEESIQEDLIGGIRVEAQDELLDNTIKNKIQKLQAYITR
ncbi:MAG: F0F1 ATP synthase subunit delta [Candidatus Pacebacteria bacterium]|nr:F0F1 ATP synthase subunit delta [Candidatus Paceibacterota bacterium]MCF7863123.1 F0F1 ATP synthase subunit delta [Candidatus Paceibacterota bacterium]